MIELLASRLTLVIPLVLSLSVHEAAHAWAAWRLGDDTAKLQGRLSLDPMVHVDPVGTLLLPMLGVPFGWAKPVQVNPLRFRGVSMGLGMALVAAAGPASNVGLAALAWGLGALLPAQPILDEGLRTMVVLNLALAVFNLIPIPPLDGSRIADLWMPKSLRPLWDQVSEYGPVVLAVGFVMLLVFTGWSVAVVDAALRTLFGA